MPKRRSTYHHGSLREAAIAAAVQALDEGGLASFTLDRVARELGVTPPALYRHFESRDGLLRAVIDDVFARFAARMDAEVLAEPDPIARLRVVGRVYLRFAIENPGWFRLQFSRAGVAHGRHEDADLKYPAAVFSSIAALVGDDPALVQRTYLSLWALAHGLAGLTVERVFAYVETDADRLALADQVLDTFLAQLAHRQ